MARGEWTFTKKYSADDLIRLVLIVFSLGAAAGGCAVLALVGR